MFLPTLHISCCSISNQAFRTLRATQRPGAGSRTTQFMQNPSSSSPFTLPVCVLFSSLPPRTVWQVLQTTPGPPQHAGDACLQPASLHNRYRRYQPCSTATHIFAVGPPPGVHSILDGVPLGPCNTNLTSVQTRLSVSPPYFKLLQLKPFTTNLNSAQFKLNTDRFPPANTDLYNSFTLMPGIPTTYSIAHVDFTNSSHNSSCNRVQRATKVNLTLSLVTAASKGHPRVCVPDEVSISGSPGQHTN